jgi:hypothetical protein
MRNRLGTAGEIPLKRVAALKNPKLAIITIETKDVAIA